MKWISQLIAIVLAYAGISCANHPCRQIATESSALPQAAASDKKFEKPGSVGSAAGAAGGEASNAGSANSVMVGKLDGSRQCSEGSGTSLEDAEKKDFAGIKVISKSKRHDGKMRAAVCGNATGMMNVFEIKSDDLSKLEKLGYKKLK